MNKDWYECIDKNGGKLKSNPDFRIPQCFDEFVVIGGLNGDVDIWEYSRTSKRKTCIISDLNSNISKSNTCESCYRRFWSNI
jgi:hypothetical protein